MYQHVIVQVSLRQKLPLTHSTLEFLLSTGSKTSTMCSLRRHVHDNRSTTYSQRRSGGSGRHGRFDNTAAAIFLDQFEERKVLK